MTILDYLPFGRNAKQRLFLPHAGGVFDGAKGVKHQHVGHIPTGLGPSADLTREPVMAVDQIVMKILPQNKIF